MKKGITLLLSVFVSSMVLTLGLGVFTLLFSEVEFSGTAKESLTAFYAADSGIECALFWDIQKNAFATSLSNSTINCDGDSRTFNPSVGFVSFNIPFDNGSCATVEVTKSASTTIIVSQGKNICVSSPKTVQRGLKVNY